MSKKVKNNGGITKKGVTVKTTTSKLEKYLPNT